MGWDNLAHPMTVSSAPISEPAADRPYLIGVAGGSSSGKTTVSERLAALAGEDHLALIKLDSYYVDRQSDDFETMSNDNYDNP